MGNVCADKATMDSNKEAAARLWQQFLAEFPTQEDCRRELYKRMSDCIRCQFCAGSNWQGEDGARSLKCLDCHKISWPTAGTFFHRVRNLQARLGAIYLIDHGVIVNAATLARLAGISYDCAWNITCRLMMVINSNFAADSLSAPSSLFAAIIARRSRETPAHMHPFSEQEVAERTLAQSPAEECQNQAALDDLSPNQRKLYEEITEEPIYFDVLQERVQMEASGMNVALMMLELAGLVSQLPGQWFKRNTSKPVKVDHSAGGRASDDDGLQERISLMISAAIDFIRPTFYGISRKYLQLYLGSFWHYIDRKRWCGGALLEACLRFRHISNEEIRQYVSPLFVNLSAA